MVTVEHSDTTVQAVEGEGVRRRDFINIAAVSFAGVGVVATLPTLINQMNPSADVLAQATTEVDLSSIKPGQAIKAVFRSQPLFVRQLTPKEIEEADAVPVSSLRDPQSLAERTKPKGARTHSDGPPRLWRRLEILSDIGADREVKGRHILPGSIDP